MAGKIRSLSRVPASSFRSCQLGDPYSSYNNLKSPALVLCIAPSYLLIPNKSSKTGVPNCRPESLQFLAEAFGDQLYPAISQVSDRPDHFKPRGHRFRIVTKSDALHPAGIKNSHPLPFFHWPLAGHSRHEAKVMAPKQYFYFALSCELTAKRVHYSP